MLPNDIISRLEVNYDAIDNEEKKEFLDAACFFIGEKKTSAIAAWDAIGCMCTWEGLLNKRLVEIDEYECIRMHNHLQDMGRKIANDKSPYHLWSPQ